MTPEQWRRVKHIVEHALDMPEPVRVTYVGHACGHDQTLREVVETLLNADEERMPFAQTPLIHLLGRLRAW